MDPVSHRGSAGPSSPMSKAQHHHRVNPHSRDDAMDRDQGEIISDGPVDRGRFDSEPRVSVGSPQNQSPGPRHHQSSRRRDRGSHDARNYDVRDSHRARPDADLRGRSQDRHRDDNDEPHEFEERPTHNDKLDIEQQMNIPTSPRHGPRSYDHPNATRDRSFSPSSRKRRRSRSPLPFPPSRSKKSRRERERDRRRRAERSERLDRERRDRERDWERERGHHRGPVSSRHDRQSSPPRRRSPSPRYDDTRYEQLDRAEPLSPRRRRHYSRSPPRESDFGPGPPPSGFHTESKVRDYSRSPGPSSRRSSFSRDHNSPRPTDRPPPASPEAGSSLSFEPARGALAPLSPKRRGIRGGSRKKGKYRDEPRFPPGGRLASGANSIEVNVSRRGDRRGSYGDQPPPSHPRHGHSSPPHHSGSSFHGSPTSPQPIRASRLNEPQFSPSNAFAQHRPQGDHGPPTGPLGRRGSIQSSPHPPTGPASQSRSRGFSRGSFRGGFNSSRGGTRSGPSMSTQWNSGDRASSGQGHSGENTPVPRSPSHPASVHSTAHVREEVEDDEHPPAPSSDSRMDDAARERSTSEHMPPPRPPPTAPTGPASSKFSFAFKATSKTTVATPKPEISQKFSAAPKKEAPPPIDDRDRDLPKDTPREPASARARADHHGRPPPPPPQPRTRTVKKLVRRLKPKAELQPDFAKSDSVFFRKPGNESVIGSGTYGKVFKGVHVYTEKLVALKRIRMEGERDGFPVTAIREIKLLQSLKHLNIVQLQEVMVEKNDCFMVFEYLSHDLTGLLNHPSYKLDPAQKKHLALQLFEGLDYLHQRGVLHRDIKAANILVSNEGILKLADFGLARFYAKRHRLDYTNRVITIWYRSPELLLGETQYDAAVDIWSAACVMVEIFTRHAIFPGDGGEINQLEKIYNVIGTPNKTEWPGLVEMPWFELLRPGYRRPNMFADKYKERVPAAAFDLLAEMFQYDPAKRPSAADVLEHPYFTTEFPPPRQAVELKDIQGDWHEFESKALRREKEKQERDARRAATSSVATKDSSGQQREKDRKRPPSAHEVQRDPKRQHIEGQPPAHPTQMSGSSTTGTIVGTTVAD